MFFIQNNKSFAEEYRFHALEQSSVLLLQLLLDINLQPVKFVKEGASVQSLGSSKRAKNNKQFDYH